MRLKILADESLDSYVSRCRLVFQGNAERLKSMNLDGWRWSVANLKVISEFLGWPGIYGFNKLLHEHTAFPIAAILESKRDRNRSYSRGYYNSSEFLDYLVRGKPSTKIARYCLECAREDYKKIGFPYARRSHQYYVKACSVHRVWLRDCCQFCGSGYQVKSFTVGTLWERCECGQSFMNGVAEPCKDYYELKFADLCRDIYSCAFHLPEMLVDDAIRNRGKTIDGLRRSWLKSRPELDCNRFLDVVKVVRIRGLYTKGEWLNLLPNQHYLICIFLLFLDFNELLMAIRYEELTLTPIDSRWGFDSVPYFK